MGDINLEQEVSSTDAGPVKKASGGLRTGIMGMLVILAAYTMGNTGCTVHLGARNNGGTPAGSYNPLAHDGNKDTIQYRNNTVTSPIYNPHQEDELQGLTVAEITLK